MAKVGKRLVREIVGGEPYEYYPPANMLLPRRGDLWGPTHIQVHPD